MRDERLRKINEVYAQRMVEIQTTQQARPARGRSRRTTAAWPSCRPSTRPASQKLDEKYRGLKEKIRARHETAWNATGRPAGARGWRGSRPTLDAVGREVDALRPALGRPGLGRPPAPARHPAGGPLRRGPARPRRSCRGGVSADPRLMEGIPTALHVPRPAALPRPRQPADRGPARGPRGGASACSRRRCSGS